MNAPDVTIRRLTATTHVAADADSVDPGARIGRLLAGVAERRLNRALQAVALPTGTWCLRQLDVPVRLDLTASDPAVEEAWAATLAAALATALRNPALAVRFADDRDALTDLVAGLASGRPERAWAWRQLGLLQAGDAEPAGSPREALLAALARRPEHAVGTVVRATARVGLAALHRTLGTAGWAALAEVVDDASGALPRIGSERRGTTSTATERRLVGGTSEAAEQRLAAHLVASSSFAAAVRRSTLRPDPATLDAWALLVAAEVDPSIPRRSGAPAVLGAVAAMLAPSATQPRHPTSIVDDGAGPRAPEEERVAADGGSGAAAPPTALPAAAAGSAVRDRAQVDPAAGRPNPSSSGAAAADPAASEQAADAAGADDDGHPTAYAGLLLLLATASAAGVPDEVLDEPDFAGRSLPWVLHHVAAGLGVPPADPAAAAFAGLDPARRLPWSSNEPATETELATVDLLTRRWSHATAVAMGQADDEPTDLVGRIIRRSGVIDWAPGWTEVRLPLGEVDLDVRRAGLDLDPGWVPWLGTVVRYVYE